MDRLQLSFSALLDVLSSGHVHSMIIYTKVKWMSLAFSFLMVATIVFYIFELIFVVWRNFKRFNEDKNFARRWR